ncbi:MAG: hypothetical protein RL571_22 [Pseudomonadota bacterium]|jgi:hypothetical protein
MLIQTIVWKRHNFDLNAAIKHQEEKRNQLDF